MHIGEVNRYRWLDLRLGVFPAPRGCGWTDETQRVCDCLERGREREREPERGPSPSSGALALHSSLCWKPLPRSPHHGVLGADMTPSRGILRPPTLVVPPPRRSHCHSSLFSFLRGAYQQLEWPGHLLAHVFIHVCLLPLKMRGSKGAVFSAVRTPVP